MIDGDLSNLVYVDHFGGNDIEETSMCREALCICRYHMRYTRGWGAFGDLLAKLPTLSIDGVAIQKETLAWKSMDIEFRNEDREGLQQELDLSNNRWGIERKERSWGKQDAAIDFDGLDSESGAREDRTARVAINGSWGAMGSVRASMISSATTGAYHH